MGVVRKSALTGALAVFAPSAVAARGQDSTEREMERYR